MDAPILTGSQRLESNARFVQVSQRPRRAHLVGIAGSGMRAMAEALLGWGWKLSGSDLILDGVHPLGALGAHLCQGHAAEHLPAAAELVLFSDAIPADNPELRRAAELGIPTVSYFQMLGRLSEGRRTLAIAGTHGKSTVTGMAAHLLIEAGCDPTVFCGAAPLGKTSGGRAGRLGPQSSRHTPCAVRNVLDAVHPSSGRHTECACYDNDLMLVEACEYRANFLHLRPQHAVILGIESDHFDCYGSLQQIEAAFQQFAASVPADGLVLARHDCPSTRRVIAGLTCRVETFGLDPDADWSAENLAEERGLFRFGICHQGRKVCNVRLPVPGRHNVLNALAAAALACENGLSGEQVAAGLAGFPGLQRRLEMRGIWRGVTLIDDYAHHPTEVAAALAAVRGLFPRRRVWCVFQPHQVSRTERLLDELAESLQNADKVLVSEIFRAREGDPRPGEVTAADLARQARAGGVEVLPARTDEEIRRTLETCLAPGDVLIVMGAGDTAGLWPEGSRRLARPLVAGGTL